MALTGTNKYGQSLADIQARMKANRKPSVTTNNNKYNDEARRKALAGQALTDPSNKANQAIYDNTRSQMGGLTTDRYAEEAVRKANAGIALQNPNNATNQAVYKQAQQSGSNNVFDIVKALNASKNATQGTTQGTTQGQSANQFNSNSLIDSIYNNSRDAQLQALRKAQETAQQGLNREETGAKQNAYDSRNQADVTASQNAQRLREAMANMGIDRSGDNLTLQAGQNAQRQGALGSINRDEGNRLQNILEQRGVIDNNMAKDEQALIQQLNAVRAQQQLQQSEADRQFGLQEGGLTGQYQGNQTLAGLQNSQQYGLQQGSLTGQYQGSPTLAGQQYQSQEQQRGLDNQFRQDSFEFTKAQNDWENTFRNQQFDFQKANALWDQNFQNKNFQQSINQFAQSMGLNYAQLGQRDKEFLAEQTYQNEAMQLNKDQFKYSQMQDATEAGFRRLDNEARSSQETKPMGAGDYKTNPDFAQDYSFIIQSPEQALGALEQNAEQFIQTYGLDGYRALLERAQGGG